MVQELTSKVLIISTTLGESPDPTSTLMLLVLENLLESGGVSKANLILQGQGCFLRFRLE